MTTLRKITALSSHREGDSSGVVVGDKYVSAGGSNSNSGSRSSPYKTIAYGWSQISNGQTLVLLDDITEDLSGLSAASSGSWKTLVGETPIKKVTTTDLTFASGAKYHNYRNIEFVATDGDISMQDSTYQKFFLCGFYGGYRGTNVGNVVSHNSGSYQLYEDCYFLTGGGRYGTLNFQATNTIYRRCVLRTEANIWGPPDSNPTGGYTIYSSTNIELQNCIAVDCLNQGSTSEWLGGINLLANVGASSNQIARGCIVADLGSDNIGYQTDGLYNDPSSLINCISVRNSYGFTGGTHNPATVTITGGEYSLNTNNGLASFGPNVSASGANVYGNGGGNFNGVSSSGNTQNAISNIATRMAGMKRIGAPGSMYGETGYATDQATDLFPFPNEDLIRTRFATLSTRGFCGGSYTLTNYLKR